MRPERKSSFLSDADYNFTVMLLGDSCTGKTCLLIRFKDNTFMNNNFISTVGIDYRNKIIEMDKHKVKLQVWDTAGQERFRSLTASYYRDADALLLIYDVTNRSSFENIRDWLAQVKEYAKEEVDLTLVGNKIDLGQQRKVRPEEGRQLAKAYDIAFIETSAKSGQNVHELFVELSKRLVTAAAQKGARDGSDEEADRTILDLMDPKHGQTNGSRRNWIGGGGSRCCSTNWG